MHTATLQALTHALGNNPISELVTATINMGGLKLYCIFLYYFFCCR
jgi:hypothetical protein